MVRNGIIGNLLNQLGLMLIAICLQRAPVLPSPEPSVQKSEGDKKPAGHEATPETKYVGEFLYDTPQQGDVVLSEEQQLQLEKVLLDIQALEDPQNLVATPNSEVSGPQLLSIIYC